VQFRPDFVNPSELSDVRVRKAISHAIDRKALAEALLGEHGIAAEILRPRTVTYYAAVEGAATKYPYDLQRSAQLMAEAGFQRRADGTFLRSSGGTPLSIEVRGIGEGQEAQETTIVANNLQQAGFGPELNLVPAAMRRASAEFRSTFPALTTNYQAIGEELDKLLTSAVGTRENQYSGGNRGGWSHPEYDLLYEAYYNTLEPAQRMQHLAQVLALISAEVPVMPLYFNLEVVAHAVSLRGPRHAEPDTTRYWDIHEWQWQ
jgi:peptide/nickel transport system substrate-binding protein